MPQLPGLAPLLRRLGPTLSTYVLRGLRALVVRGAEPTARLRRELALPPVPGHPLFAGMFSAPGTLALYSRHFAPPQPDYPPDTLIAGFTFYDAAPPLGAALPASLARFLASGPPPVVFTLGSFVARAGERFFEASLEAARAVGVRAVLVVGESDTRLYPSGADVCVCDYAPYSALFPHALAIAHQCGIGTTAQALRAGKPQLAVPFYGDQPDNAAHLARLGVARVVRPARYRPAVVARALRALIEDRSMARRAAALGPLIEAEDGADEAAQHIDRLLADQSALASVPRAPRSLTSSSSA
jgi:UDP:flavonoid glycosyltransferase YjiC (YdhE family)